MTTNWTYSGNPAESDRDAVRFLIGDTDPTDMQLGDNEIDYLLQTEGSITKTALICAEALAAKYTRLVDETVGAVSLKLSQRADAYRKLAVDLKRRNDFRSSMPYAGGISQADKEAEESDTDRVKPAFTRDLHELDNEDLEDCELLGHS